MRLLVGDGHLRKELNLIKRTTICKEDRRSFFQKMIAGHLTEQENIWSWMILGKFGDPFFFFF